MDDDINQIAEDFDVDEETAEEIQDLSDAAGIDLDDAHMLYEEGIGPGDI